jgi:hypothetical protein
MSWLDFEAGVCVGSWVTSAAVGITVWLRRRRDRRRNEARAREMAATIQRFFLGGPTPGCDCPVCADNRAGARKGAN